MAVRSGFVARSMLRNFGPLSVSFGFGGLDGELLPLPVDPFSGLQEGVGEDVFSQAFVAKSPKASIFFPDHKLDPRFFRSPVTVTIQGAPRVTAFFPNYEYTSTFLRAPVIASTVVAPTTTLYPSEKKETAGSRSAVLVTKPKAPSMRITKPKKKG